MNKKQSNKFNAYQGIQGVLDLYSDIIDRSEMLGQVVNEFNHAIDEILEVSALTESDTTGETSAKKLAKDRMAYTASSLAACGAVYAVDKSDKELEASLDYTYSDIKYGLDEEALHMAMAIESILLGHRDKLRVYMVTDQDLEDLHQKIMDYDAALKNRGGAKSEAVSQNKRLTQLFRSTDDLLERKMDRLAFRLKQSFPEFYDAYSNARLIDDL
jgi:hypothetical protein